MNDETYYEICCHLCGDSFDVPARIWFSPGRDEVVCPDCCTRIMEQPDRYRVRIVGPREGVS